MYKLCCLCYKLRGPKGRGKGYLGIFQLPPSLDKRKNTTKFSFVCMGNQKRGKLASISFHNDAANLNMLEIEFDCRPVSFVICQKEFAFVSLLSGYIVALQLIDGAAKILWELKVRGLYMANDAYFFVFNYSNFSCLTWP